MPANTDTFSGSISRAVRAEMGRQNKKLNALVPVLERTWPTISSRLNGHTAFTSDELDKVAKFLGISPYDLVESAALSERFAETSTDDEVARITPPQVDVFAQPARSKRRAS